MGADPYAGSGMDRSDATYYCKDVVLDTEFDYWGYILVMQAGTISIVTAGGDTPTLTIANAPYTIPILTKKVATLSGGIPVAMLKVLYNRPKG